MQSVPITTKVVSSNPEHDEVYSIQHYVIKFVSDLRQVGSFRQVLRFPSPVKFTTKIVESGLKHENPNPQTQWIPYRINLVKTNRRLFLVDIVTDITPHSQIGTYSDQCFIYFFSIGIEWHMFF